MVINTAKDFKFSGSLLAPTYYSSAGYDILWSLANAYKGIGQTFQEHHWGMLQRRLQNGVGDKTFQEHHWGMLQRRLQNGVGDETMC